VNLGHDNGAGSNGSRVLAEWQEKADGFLKKLDALPRERDDGSRAILEGRLIGIRDGVFHKGQPDILDAARDMLANMGADWGKMPDLIRELAASRLTVNEPFTAVRSAGRTPVDGFKGAQRG
jgi:hypothetical protein